MRCSELELYHLPSRLQKGKEEADCMRQTSELFTSSTAVKFANALNMLSLKLLLIVIEDSASSN